MLHHKNVHLVPPSKSHLSALVMYANQGGLWDNYLTKRKTTIQEQQRKLADYSLRSDSYTFVITEGGKQPIGVCEMLNISWIHRTARLQMWFENRANTVPQYGARALSAALNHVFGSMNLNKVYTDVRLDDVVMVNLFKNHGFQSEIRKRSHYFAGGKYSTVLEMGLLAQEYQTND